MSSLPTFAGNPEKPSTSLTGESNTAAEASLSTQQHSSAIANEAGDGAGASAGSSAAQNTKSEVEKAADKLYEERIEDEYAKREGGA